jgi:hypothetical protein
MAQNANEEIIAFGMTHQEVMDAVGVISREYVENDEDSGNYSEYAQAIKRGRETLKRAGYYPHLPRGAQ